MPASPKRLFYLPEPIPGQASGNSYLDSMARAWEQAGYVRIPFPRGRKAIIEAIKARGGTTCVANFIENQMVTRDGKFRLAGLLSYFKDIVRIHLVARNFVFVRHDVFPHSAKGKSQAFLKSLVDLSERLAFDKVLVHSTHYKGRFRKYLPHPVYQFGQAQTDEAASSPSDDLIYFGNFGPYKRLDLLIEAWNRPSRLILAGECRDVAILESLKALAKGKNIEFMTHWLSDDEARRLIRSCAAMIVPQSSPSYIVSGSLYFGLSCGVPVICNRLPHARALVAEGWPGIICIEDLSELNGLDVEAIKAIDRRRVEERVQALCGIDAIAALIKQQV